MKTAKEKNVFGVLSSGCIPEGDPVSLHSPSSEDDDEADEEAASNQVWSLTQYYSVDFSQSRIGLKKCVFNKRTIKVYNSCC